MVRLVHHEKHLEQPNTKTCTCTRKGSCGKHDKMPRNTGFVVVSLPGPGGINPALQLACKTFRKLDCQRKRQRMPTNRRFSGYLIGPL